MLDDYRVTIAIPCLNEAAGLRTMLPRMPSYVDEVLVIDNGSTDDTSAIARAGGARVVHEVARGYGWACQRALREASGDLVVKLDGDCTYPLEAIEPLLRALIAERLDFVTGCRFPLRDPRAMPWMNRLGNAVLTAAANWCFGLRMADSLSGMWAIRRSAVAQLELRQGGVPFSQEIKIEAFRRPGLRAREAPIRYHTRIGSSKLMPLRDGNACLRFLLRRRWELARQQQDPGRLAWWTDQISLIALLAAAALWPLSPALKEAGVVIAAIAWLIGKAVTRTGCPRINATLPLVLWFLAGVGSMVNSVSLPASLHGLQKILKAAMIVWVAADVIRTNRRMLALAIAVMTGAALASLDGLAQFVFGTDLLYHHPAGIAMDTVPRLTATFHHANDFGIYGVSVLPVGLAVALGAARRWTRWCSFGTFGVLSLAVLLTFSRGAALAGAVSLLVFWVARRAWKTLALIGCLGACAVLLLPAPIRAWATTQASWFDMLVLPERPQMWQTAVNMITAHPIIGVGVNTFVLNYDRFRGPGDQLHPAYAHNHYLQLAAEIGLLGLLAFGWLLMRSAGVWRRLLRSDDAWRRLISTGLWCGIIGFLTIGLLESALYSSHTNLGFWLWLGLLHGLGLQNSRDPNRSLG